VFLLRYYNCQIKADFMKKLSLNILLLGGLILVGGCGAQEQINNVQDIAETAQEKVQQVQGLLAHKDHLLTMKDDVTKTVEAVKAGDFATAQQQFSTIKTNWDGIQSTLGNNPDASVQAIQTSIEGISTDLGASSPDQTKILGGLESLSTSLAGVLTGGESQSTAEPNDATEATADGTMTTEETTTQAEGETAPSTTDSKAQTFANNLLAMKDSLQKSSDALNSGDYGAVKEAFGTARQTWFQFGGSVKAQSEETYQVIDGGVKTLNTALAKETPEQAMVKSGLDSLLTALDQVAK
jgi:hypothetical protein